MRQGAEELVSRDRCRAKAGVRGGGENEGGREGEPRKAAALSRY